MSGPDTEPTGGLVDGVAEAMTGWPLDTTSAEDADAWRANACAVLAYLNAYPAEAAALLPAVVAHGLEEVRRILGQGGQSATHVRQQALTEIALIRGSVPRCVVCGLVVRLDDDGLCEDHKYDPSVPTEEDRP